MNDETKRMITIIAISFLIIGIIIVFGVSSTVEKKPNYKIKEINFEKDSTLYKLKILDEYIEVEEYSKSYCGDGNCKPEKRGSYKLEYDEYIISNLDEYNENYYCDDYFSNDYESDECDSTFDNIDKKNGIVYYEEDLYNKRILYDILDISYDDIEYYVSKHSSYEETPETSKKKGYILENRDGSYVLTIFLGDKKIDYDEDDIEVEVLDDEIEVKIYDYDYNYDYETGEIIDSDEFSSIQIRFDEKPTIIKVINDENEEYEEIET